MRLRPLLLLFVYLCLLACATYVPPPNINTPYQNVPPVVNPPVAPVVPQPPPNMAYLENATIKVGVDLAQGGAMTYLSYRGGPNMINNHDAGRLIQCNLYGGPYYYHPPGTERWPTDNIGPIGWNPVTSGDIFNYKSVVLESRKSASEIYVRLTPKLWTLKNVPAECQFEYWISLEPQAVSVRHKAILSRSDTTQYQAQYGQETPSVYLNGIYRRIVAYRGARPFTNDALNEQTPRDGGNYYFTSENWSALVNDAGLGLGLYVPNKFRGGAAYFNSPYGQGGEFDDPTGLISGDERILLDHNAVYEHTYKLIPGTVNEIRAYVYTQPRPVTRPNYYFTDSRHRWCFERTRDRGLPIRGELDIDFSPDNLKVVSPPWCYLAAEVPKLYIQAAFTTTAKTARVRWRGPDSFDFDDGSAEWIDFPIIGDGVYRTYVLDMSSKPNWTGAIQQLSIQHAPGDPLKPGQRLRLKSVTADAP